jgi:hypothetical protein
MGNLNINYNEKIDRYLYDDLPDDEVLLFEQELEVDEDLRNEMEFYKDIDEAIAEDEIIEFRQEISDIFDKVDKEDNRNSFLPKFNKKFYYGMAAASVAVITSIGLYINNRTFTDAELFEKYYQPYENHNSLRSGDQTTNEILRKAFEMYEAEKYQEASDLFELVLTKDFDNIPAHLYSGISNIEIEEYIEARKSFEFIIEDDNSLFVEQAEWYLAWCYLKTGNKAKAKELFSKISENDTHYSENANKVLKRMR